MENVHILAKLQTDLTLAAARWDAAKSAYSARLGEVAAVRLAQYRALRTYELDPSDDNHVAYVAAHQAEQASETVTGALAAQRMAAFEAHRVALQAVEAVQRLRHAISDVKALGLAVEAVL